jgi:DNA replication and repair protein RecF
MRNLEASDLDPAAGINWFHGDNGAGKTSVLEAIYILARGRSFRSARLGGVIQHDRSSLEVVVRLDTGARLGLQRARDDWRGRINGRDTRRISEFASALPLVLIEPDSHRLVDGGPDRRRSYLDWQLFHVEQAYLDTWKRYARLLRQRNAALKSGASAATLNALEGPLVAAAESINSRRVEQVTKLGAVVEGLLAELRFRLPGTVQLHYRPGHPLEETLADALIKQRDSDRERGFTQRGPHRAELVLTTDGRAAAVELSRGQQKLLALSLLLAQLVVLERAADPRPLLLLDDPVSELDKRHLDALLAWLSGRDCQCWITGTEPWARADRMFHVEQGRIRPPD